MDRDCSGGESAHDEKQEYPNEYNEKLKIIWNNNPHNVYVYCSNIVPSTITKFNDEMYINLIDISGVVPDLMMSSFILYKDVCHEKMGKQFNQNEYRTNSDFFEEINPNLKSISDILQY